ncbi:hypothetical protein MASRES_GEN12897_14550 [Acinetobacter baumannii]
MSYHHLNFEDRTALMLESRKEGFSARKFAELIKRHPSTIYRELKRNSINDVYQAQYASDNTFARRRRGHRKLKIDSILWKFIVEAIRCLWSPQQIAKRLKTFPDLDQTMNVSHTTIYSTIRALPKGELKKDLLSCLRHENKKRKANGEPKKDSILQDIKTIHERPAEVQERKIPGHWEADLIKGKDNKSSIATLIERNTRLCILATLPDAKAESVRKALTEALKYLPAELRKTLTYDRGREMSEHKILEEDLGIDVYFCDPHSPWQKGTCENMNGLIRQYLPKGIDLNQADQHYLNQVAMSLNTRPRKALDWLTPLEKFAQLVDYHMAFETVARPNNFPNINVQKPNGINLDDIAARYKRKAENKKNVDGILAFASLSMPKDALNKLVTDVTKAGGVVVFRGFKDGNYMEMAKAISQIGVKSANIQINPNAFKQYRVDSVPAIVLVKPRAEENLDEEGCVLPENHSKITGDISLEYALEQMEKKETAELSQIAKRYLTFLKGANQ